MNFETWLQSDLTKPLKVQALHGVFFSADNAANLIGVEVYNNGTAASLSGTCIGYAIRADGGTLTITGTVSGNKASIILPTSAYVIEGPLDVVIKVVSGSVKTTVGACRGYVQRATTDTIIDPGHVIPSLEELLAQIDACEQATDAANTAATNANSKATAANTATTRANNAAAALENMDATATTLSPGSSATASVSTVSGHYRLALGVPKGDIGPAPTITNTATTYQNSTSGTTIPTGTWQTTQPTTPQGQFLWVRTILTWDNGQTTTLYSVSRMGIDGSGSVVSVNNVSPDANGNVTLPVDTTPTSGSTNPVTSGGVYTALAAKAPLASPQFSGSPTAPTPASGTDSTRIATTAFVNAALANNSGLSMPTLSNVSTVAELNSELDTAISGMPEGGILHFRVNTTAAFGLFLQGAVYFGVLYKSALNQYCHVMFYPNYLLAPISGVRLGAGWSYARLLTGELETTTLTATLRNGGTSGTALATGTATIKRNEGFIDFKLSITDCANVAITSFASITFSSSLPAQIPAYFPIMIRRGGQAYFIATSQNNAGASLTIRGGDIGSQGNPSWTFMDSNTEIYAHEFVAI